MIHHWLNLFHKFVQHQPLPNQHRPPDHHYASYDDISPWRRLFGRAPEMMDVEAEVADEQQGRVVLLSRDDHLGRLLLTRLRDRAPAPTVGHLVREGFFTLVTLPALTPHTDNSPVANDAFIPGSFDPWAEPEALVDHLTQIGPSSDLFLYILCEDEGWQPADTQWCARLRVCAAPLLPVILTSEFVHTGDYTEAQKELAAAIQRDLAVCPVFVTRPSYADATAAQLGDFDAALAVKELVQRMLALRPRLAMALAQEVTCCRPDIARRVIRTATLLSALVSSEPIPLLDLPLQVSVQWKMALQLAAIYGRPGLDYHSRELISTVLINVGARRVAQQLLKLIPVVGWVASSALSALTTWALGNALLRYYNEGHILTLPPVSQSLHLSQRIQALSQKVRKVHQWRAVRRTTPPT